LNCIPTFQYGVAVSLEEDMMLDIVLLSAIILLLGVILATALRIAISQKRVENELEDMRRQFKLLMQELTSAVSRSRLHQVDSTLREHDSRWAK
jgi:hypothetical protein